ncbi:tetracycline resistance efflux system leader peptide [Cytobacillus solani]|nr:tetracycline resistance efflux system leader peptide [Cytobacillus solani]
MKCNKYDRVNLKEGSVSKAL